MLSCLFLFKKKFGISIPYSALDVVVSTSPVVHVVNFYRPQTKFAKGFHRCLSVYRGVSVSVPGGLCLGGSLSGGVSVREITQYGMCVRYALYWNAFLFEIDLIIDVVNGDQK